jgi:succinate dehydrogenase / fumarate reductase cytochrome b subunit
LGKKITRRFVRALSYNEGNYCTVNKQRPKNLNLLTIRFPIPALVSILHRVSGVVLFLMIPLMLWVLDNSLSSQNSFQALRDNLSTPLAKGFVWLFLAPFLYHFVAGIRHLLMDINIGIELKSGRLAAILTIIIAFLLIVLAGIYIW